MGQDIFLWCLLVIYTHVILYVNLARYTTVRTFKNYRTHNDGIVYIVLITQIIILIGFELLKYGPQ